MRHRLKEKLGKGGRGERGKSNSFLGRGGTSMCDLIKACGESFVQKYILGGKSEGRKKDATF